MANAPHIPVHLGAMQEAVQWQLNYLQGDLHEGDVLLSNHPAAGGSHLPDLTVITPVSVCVCVCVCVTTSLYRCFIPGVRDLCSLWLAEDIMPISEGSLLVHAS